MKKSAQVTLTVVAAVGLASCGRGRRDPCQPEYFNEMACQQAVSSGGYYWGGSWYPMVYHYPYPYYYDSYHTFTSRGGHVTMAPSGSYTKPAGAGKTFGTGGGASSSGGVERGGFGSTGSGGSSGG
jgi:uncharacterized membrane protein YgcG